MSLLEGYEYLFATAVNYAQDPGPRAGLSLTQRRALENARANMESAKGVLRKLEAELDAAENPQGRGPLGGVRDNPFDRVSTSGRTTISTTKIARIKAAIKTKKKDVERKTKAHAAVVKKQNPTPKDNRSASMKRADAKKNPFAGAKGGKGGKGPKGSSGSVYGTGVYGGDDWNPNAADKSVPQRPKGDKGTAGKVGPTGLPGKKIPMVGKQPMGNKMFVPVMSRLQKRVQELKDIQAKNFAKNPKSPDYVKPKPAKKPTNSALIPWYDKRRPTQNSGYNTPGHRNYDSEWYTRYPAIKTPYGWRPARADEINKAKKAAKAERLANDRLGDLNRKVDEYNELLNPADPADRKISVGGDREALIETLLEEAKKKVSENTAIIRDAESDIAKIAKGIYVSIKKVYDKKKGTSGPKGPKGILGIDGTTNQVLTKPGGDQYGTHHTHPTHPHAPH